jgi:hypothetical protein
LAATGTASVRRRKLPAEHVVWLVIGMGLFHDRSIAEVVHHLDLVLPPRGGGRGRVSNAAIVQARDQLGAAPLRKGRGLVERAGQMAGRHEGRIPHKSFFPRSSRGPAFSGAVSRDSRL